ncbi:selenoprotein S-like [Hetaerina americana]|uniref:selenoprotein S-like n=1 Tax=Hetaerina americana TaxID=62018 RepID=UPI003A7F25F6
MDQDDNVHPPTLEEQTPEFLSAFINSGSNFLSDYGWYIVILASVSYYIWTKKAKYVYGQWKKQMDEKDYAAKYHKDPTIFQSIQETMEANRRKMQEELEIKAKQYMEKQKEMEEAHRLERIADWERHEKGLGYRSKFKVKEEDSGTSSQKPVKPNLRPEYNPLMGSGGSSGYRPPKRSCCSGGGCG